jgi:hypothetical protein
MKDRTTSTLISTVLGEFKMDAAMTAPCSVRANGRYWRPPRRSVFEITICDLKVSCSSRLASSRLGVRSYANSVRIPGSVSS